MSSASKKPTGDRFLVLFNPTSGGWKIRAHDGLIQRFFLRHGINYDFYYFIPGEEVPVCKLVEKYKPAKILVAGGDGTLRSVCEKIYWAKIDLPVAFYPLGSANAFALLLGVPQRLKYLLTAQEKAVFPGILNNKKIFLIAACFGHIATMSTRAHKYHKQLLGPFSYLLSTVHKGWFFPRRKIHLGSKTTKAHSVVFCLPEFVEGFLPNIESAPRKLTILTVKKQYTLGILEMIFAKGVQNKPHRQLDVSLAESISFSGLIQGDVHLDGDTFTGTDKKHRLVMGDRPLRFLVKV